MTAFNSHTLYSPRAFHLRSSKHSLPISANYLELFVSQGARISIHKASWPLLRSEPFCLHSMLCGQHSFRRSQPHFQPYSPQLRGEGILSGQELLVLTTVEAMGGKEKVSLWN